ncbi:MAG TPA: hypothetical protein VEA80_08850 [Vitreimonas sp.]|uniref:hypothetical protein n=1 Tax=Vitreimonas sp. TaxID=3069702 RepID=UPI002D65AEC8|nr:hypothetical protein [Vitreimonas sp.]HYD87568.1 hypothetical protein [Vitreimonas sp.]
MPDTLTAARGPSSDAFAMALARGLGAFSIALGLAELLAPRRLNDAIGADAPNLTRAYGAREIITGAGLLAAKDPTPWIWARLAGDVLDLATLAAAGRGANSKGASIGTAIALVAGVTALDLLSAQRLHNRTGTKSWFAHQRDESLIGALEETDPYDPNGMLHRPPEEGLRVQ